MSTELVAVVAATVSGAFAVLTALIARRNALRDRRMEVEELAMRYRIPLMHAAFDLQSRLYNICRLRFLQRFSADTSSAQEREYAIDNTLYLIGQYLCFSEIIRRGMLFVSDRRQDRAFTEAMERVRDWFASTETDDRTLCLFRGEQRAVGEVMLVESAKLFPGDPRWDCLGYATFVKSLQDPDVERWFGSLRQSLETLTSDLEHHDQRLKELQHALLDLLTLLDPNHEHLPEGLRQPL
jgi:hypothetical protein